MTEETKPEPVCVLCGRPWTPGIKNVCECGGFCTWGEAKGAEPDSWEKTAGGGYIPRRPPEQKEKGDG
jgi:hypothetical protein